MGISKAAEVPNLRLTGHKQAAAVVHNPEIMQADGFDRRLRADPSRGSRGRWQLTNASSQAMNIDLRTDLIAAFTFPTGQSELPPPVEQDAAEVFRCVITA